MCGIAGVLDLTGESAGPDLEATARRMADSLEHRGPDDSGTWVDERAGLAFGHRRLSIVDLSPAGHQPMVSKSGRYVLTFNGEIYNFLDLRAELERQGSQFNGGSDTEVMLAAFEEWGVPNAVRSFNGMFAFALWDRAAQTLHLSRDRFGEKPLYYGWAGRALVFGSELKALRVHPRLDLAYDQDAITLYLRHNFFPAPFTVYRSVRKVRPGTIATFTSERPLAEPAVETYWSLRETVERGLADPFPGTEGDAVEELDALLSDSVRMRMIADVPLGAFLSGGIDSSTVVAMMQRQSATPVRTFTIGFAETGYNEAMHAKSVARHLRTQHTELYVSAEEALELVPSLPRMYDEPFADSSQIPTHLVSVLARRSVTVALSGDGGDELFAGYAQYPHGSQIWDRMARIDQRARGVAGKAIGAFPVRGWDQLGRLLRPVLPSGTLSRGNFGPKVHKFGRMLPAAHPEEMYRILVSQTVDPGQFVVGSLEPRTAMSDPDQWVSRGSVLDRMMYLDSLIYLPDDILVKVDRASMAVSLETRVPLLDHRIAEFAWRLSANMKMRDGKGKWILRRVLDRYVPPTMVDRAKMGFAVPVADWIRGPLRSWADDLLDEQRMRDQGVFDANQVRMRWRQHLANTHDWSYFLWGILMFRAWAEDGNGRSSVAQGIS